VGLRKRALRLRLRLTRSGAVGAAITIRCKIWCCWARRRVGTGGESETGITAETDLRFCRCFGLSKGYWLRAQVAYDTEVAEGAAPLQDLVVLGDGTLLHDDELESVR
jgi:hypothetical protein